jgi:hypothetical protein
MTLRVSASRVLKDSLAYPSDEPFEQALGRAVRRHGGGYEDYVSLISIIRDAARERKIPLREAARRLSDQV